MPDSLYPAANPPALAERLAQVRARSLALAEGLSPEDMVVQSMPDASPVKWHLAHTTWFFETFVLGPQAGQPPLRPEWGYLFNSYYEAAGPRHPRPRRGLLTRPPVAEVLEWRSLVDRRLMDFLAQDPSAEAQALIELGLNHEQQHQELILTDLKHLLSGNSLMPAYRERPEQEPSPAPPLGWAEHPGGLAEIGWDGKGFAFDNEGPRHKVWLEPFAIADRPVTCGEWLAFMADGGYRDPSLWLSDGWAAVRAEGWEAPAYWRRDEDGGWVQFTLAGERPVNQAEPVAHVSLYEADAFARWASAQWTGARLPTEAEWEMTVGGRKPTGGFADAWRFHPQPLTGPSWWGEVWEWTGSAYLAYPGFRPAEGAVGEYNGKFMSGQMVLRGGSCATPEGHVRPTYRNFFPPAARWQFSGLRLARDLE
ncbi:ergothioneine biosynthesis protein EgtB [Indioceanicola profundi]|uniref:ergothioneine biosynthesis protein EgtB n=1 Tax=Indioceanicola profundi TaxID=2220096 RepID=UPI000E6AD17E|nr:ergothioneine biosynthesis protein EgtB [Indioceanicola profundi]